LRTFHPADARRCAGGWRGHGGIRFLPASPRLVSPELAPNLPARRRGRAEIASLTVDADDETIGKIVETVNPDWLQLHARKPRRGLPRSPRDSAARS